MSTRARVAVAAAVALISAAGIAIMVAHWAGGGGHASAPSGLSETAAVAPFVGYREVRVAIAGRCVRVVVADTEPRRERGLRATVGRLGPYGGMLFAQATDGDVAFTMAGVNGPLDVAWYTADGIEVGSVPMRPCPHDAAHCPLYRAGTPYRFALETPPSPGAPTRLVRCG
jgi:uncharacterized membrane protein (UPF0127 family)